MPVAEYFAMKDDSLFGLNWWNTLVPICRVFRYVPYRRTLPLPSIAIAYPKVVVVPSTIHDETWFPAGESVTT